MTEKEFCSLKYGTVVSERFNPEKYYVINDEDVFGITDKDLKVYGATELDGKHQIRISKENAQFWNIEGAVK